MSTVKRTSPDRFSPTSGQAHKLAQTLGGVRFVFEWARVRHAGVSYGREIRLSSYIVSVGPIDFKPAGGPYWLATVPLPPSLRQPEHGLLERLQEAEEYLSRGNLSLLALLRQDVQYTFSLGLAWKNQAVCGASGSKNRLKNYM